MTRFILTLEMTQPMGGSVLISCAIVGDPGNVRGLTRQIGTMLEAEPVLRTKTPVVAGGVSRAPRFSQPSEE